MAPAGPPVVLQLDGGAVGRAVHIHGDGVHLGYKGSVDMIQSK